MYITGHTNKDVVVVVVMVVVMVVVAVESRSERS